MTDVSQLEGIFVERAEKIEKLRTIFEKYSHAYTYGPQHDFFMEILELFNNGKPVDNDSPEHPEQLAEVDE